MFGVDKHNMGSFTLSKTHDFEKLFSNSNVKLNTHGDKMALYDENTGEKIEFQCITISDDERFDTLHFGLKKVGQATYKEYITLNVFLENDEGTGNLVPSNQSEVISNQKELLEYIREKYGLNLSYEGSKYTYLEINKTVEMNEDVEQYYYVLDYMRLIAPGKYKRKQGNEDGKNELCLIAMENSSVKVKMYNKTKQLKQYKNIEVSKPYLRIEVCLKDARKIQSAFGTTKVDEITDEMMWEYFERVIKIDLFDRLEKQLEKSKIELRKELKSLKAEDKKKYPKMFVMGVCSLLYKDTKIPLILDVEQAYEVLKKDVSRWDRTYKTIVKEADKRPHKKNNLIRYDEIKNKILKF